MRITLPITILAVSLLTVASVVVPQNAAAQRTLLIEHSNQPDALVFVDSVVVGRVSQRSFRLSAGASNVVVTPSVPGSWSIPPIQYQVSRASDLNSGSDTMSVDAVFPYYYSVRSTPPGAVVLSEGGRSSLGLTPLVFSRSSPVQDSLRIALEGFSTVSFLPESRLWNPIDVTLLGSSTVDLGFVSRPPKRARRWVTVLALSLVAAGGSAAVHYKFKADRRYSVYEQTGDPKLRPEIHRLDVRSGIALGVMQSGMAIIVVRLVRR